MQENVLKFQGIGWEGNFLNQWHIELCTKEFWAKFASFTQDADVPPC